MMYVECIIIDDDRVRVLLEFAGTSREREVPVLQVQVVVIVSERSGSLLVHHWHDTLIADDSAKNYKPLKSMNATSLHNTNDVVTTLQRRNNLHP